MISKGKVQVVVTSRRVPTRTVSISQPVYTMSGIRLGSQKDLRVVYGSELDQEHERAIEEGRKLANRLGLELEVVDRSRVGVFRRILSSLGGGLPQGPTLVVTPQSDEPAVSLSQSPVQLGGPAQMSSPPQAACARALTPKLFTSV